MRKLSLDKVLKEVHTQAVPVIDENTKLSILWEKVRPFVVTIGAIFGKKVRPYVKAFVAAIDAYVEEEESA